MDLYWVPVSGVFSAVLKLGIRIVNHICLCWPDGAYNIACCTSVCMPCAVVSSTRDKVLPLCLLLSVPKCDCITWKMQSELVYYYTGFIIV
ncbi:unnamed protein product [Trifolium pratense]|uniref:Uncharacterized protein n=1 Tax=Trifolium pratense TaxID=57577 RepID=A0ACB0KG61_TRIPR|nr:unnamed protein product [Trifolium pratense]